MEPRDQQTVLSALPPEWSEDVRPAIQQAIWESGRIIVVLDDDPTGTQTVHDIPVLTEWTPSWLEYEFRHNTPLFYILTNSRSVSSRQARRMAVEIGTNLQAAAKKIGRRFSVISRSDSTLRGHYPDEVDALASALKIEGAVHVIAPYFLEGGRLTIEDIHWVADGDQLIPVGETPFARDATFGYKASNLCQWVEEKTEGRIPVDSVASLSISDVRMGGPEVIRDKLCALPPGSACIVNAVTMRDLDVVVLGCRLAEVAGQTLLYRTGASFVQAFAGQMPRPLLAPRDFAMRPVGAGLIMVGSHVPRSTAQLNHLLGHAPVVHVELDVPKLLNSETRAQEINRVVQALQASLDQERDTVMSTSRELVTGSTADASLQIAGLVSAGVVDIVKRLEVRPRYILAKGGITSSDVATQGLNIKRAWVMGQVLPGVPVYRLGEESRFPGMPYIIFPGNVGDVDAITQVVSALTKPKQ